MCIRDSSKADAPEQHSLLDERLLSTPSVAVNRAMLTGGDMAEICRVALLQAMSITHKWDDALAEEILHKEDAVDHYEDVLGTYLVKLGNKHPVSYTHLYTCARTGCGWS